MLALNTLFHRLYAFGILSELQESDPQNYGEYSKLREVFQHLVGAISYLVAAYFVVSVLGSYDRLLYTFATMLILAALVFYMFAFKK